MDLNSEIFLGISTNSSPALQHEQDKLENIDINAEIFHCNICY